MSKELEWHIYSTEGEIIAFEDNVDLWCEVRAGILYVMEGHGRKARPVSIHAQGTWKTVALEERAERESYEPAV